jgi:hypothetical protein
VQCSTRQTTFNVSAALMLIAACYHVLGVGGWIDRDSSAARHATFVLISIAGAWYVRRRPLWVLPFFLLLVAQQTASHGGHAMKWWTDAHRVDVISLATLLVLYTCAVLLVLDARDRSTLVRRLVCPFAAGA